MKLGAKARNSLPSIAFGEPKKRAFPMENKAHAKAAILDSKFAPAKDRAKIKAKAEKVLGRK